MFWGKSSCVCNKNGVKPVPPQQCPTPPAPSSWVSTGRRIPFSSLNLQLLLTAPTAAPQGEHPPGKVIPDGNFHLHPQSLSFPGLCSLAWGKSSLVTGNISYFPAGFGPQKELSRRFHNLGRLGMWYFNYPGPPSGREGWKQEDHHPCSSPRQLKGASSQNSSKKESWVSGKAPAKTPAGC